MYSEEASNVVMAIAAGIVAIIIFFRIRKNRKEAKNPPPSVSDR